MAQLKVSVPDFYISSSYTCETSLHAIYNSDKTEVVSRSVSNVASNATLAAASKTFAFNLPNGATIKSAKLFVTIGAPALGVAVSTINGANVGTSTTAEVDVVIPDGAQSVAVSFTYKCVNTAHSHTSDGTMIADEWVGINRYTDWQKKHWSALNYSNVYLLIEYTPPIDFTGWTDDPLQAGETPVKAVHMTELQEWTALLSDYANNGVPTFTPAVPGETSLGLWLTQINEIRSVLDTIYPEHEAWIAVEVNRPRVDVMAQMRAVIVAAMQ